MMKDHIVHDLIGLISVLCTSILNQWLVYYFQRKATERAARELKINLQSHNVVVSQNFSQVKAAISENTQVTEQIASNLEGK